LVVNPYGYPYGGTRPATGSTGHYGVDLVTEEYATASHEDVARRYQENGKWYYWPSTQATNVVAPTSGDIIENSGETIIIKASSIEGIEVELTHVKTGPDVISNNILQTNYSNGEFPYGPNALFPHLHLTVTYTDSNNVKRDLDPRPMLPNWGLRFYAGDPLDPGVYYNDGSRTDSVDLPKFPALGEG
jgi:hypothetical protein